LFSAVYQGTDFRGIGDRWGAVFYCGFAPSVASRDPYGSPQVLRRRA